jgi:hypothetical protein
MLPGTPSPLGASPGPAETPGVNFALWAPNATAVTLCLFDWEDKPLLEAPLQRTGDVWHSLVAGLPQARAAAGPVAFCRVVSRVSEAAGLYGGVPAQDQGRRAGILCRGLPCCPAHERPSARHPPQSQVLYGFRVEGKGGWETPFRWDKNKVGCGREGSGGMLGVWAG